MHSGQLATYFGDIGIIGAGAVGFGLGYALQKAGLGPVAIASRTEARALELADGLKQGKVCTPEELVALCQTVFLTVSDDQIKKVCDELAWNAQSIVIHCSGAHSLDVLGAVHSAGGRRGAFHPLSSFPSRSLSKERFQRTFFGVESDDDTLQDALISLAEAIGQGALTVAGEKRVLYHICGVIASNYLVALVDAALDLFCTVGFTQEEGLEALLPLILATCDNIQRVGSKEALSGPIARGDTGTVLTHLKALQELGNPDLQALYVTLGRLTVNVALEKGTITDRQYEIFMDVFKQEGRMGNAEYA
ncbi:MAG: DUF2520 domain-containing protein [Limnochordia bacterium]|nr:DUF2520 domain-containing protein [Limnochordia bacterium]